VARSEHVLHLLIRDQGDPEGDRRPTEVRFLFYRNDEDDRLVLPYRRLAVDDDFRGRTLDDAVDELCRAIQLPEDSYAILTELPGRQVVTDAPRTDRSTALYVYAVDLWVEPVQRYLLADPDSAERSRLPGGVWLSLEDAMSRLDLSEPARHVLHGVTEHDTANDARRAAETADDSEPSRHGERGVTERDTADDARRSDEAADEPEESLLPLRTHPPELTMYALARKWAARNSGAVRILRRQELDRLFGAAETRPFRLRAVDPILKYQRQSVGFVWSFFTHRDPQQRHVHGSPTIEIYGVLSGELEVWWKNYQDRGVSAWHKTTLREGDWLELGSLQCHIVHWTSTEGRGVVFRAGPGPLAGRGKLGLAGMTPCKKCKCVLPPQVKALSEPGEARPATPASRPGRPA